MELISRIENLEVTEKRLEQTIKLQIVQNSALEILSERVEKLENLNREQSVKLSIMLASNNTLLQQNNNLTERLNNIIAENLNTANRNTASVVRQPQPTEQAGLNEQDTVTPKGASANQPASHPKPDKKTNQADKPGTRKKTSEKTLESLKPSKSSKPPESKQTHATKETKTRIDHQTAYTKEPAADKTAALPNKHPTTPKRGDQRRRQTCLLVHDEFHRDFDRTIFDSRFEVTKIHHNKLKDIMAPDGVRTSVRPDMVMIHAGLRDIWSGRPAGEVVNDLEHIIWCLLEHPEVKVCMSLIIPVTSYPQTNKRIEYVNREVTAIISDIRRRFPEFRDRLFTKNNSALSGFLTRSVDSHGLHVSLNPKGQNRLWLHLRDSITRTFGLLPPQDRGYQETRQHKPSLRNASYNE